MWIKSLDTDVWVNMNHITHFSIKQINVPTMIVLDVHEVSAFLDASARSLSIPDLSDIQDSSLCIGVCRD